MKRSFRGFTLIELIAVMTIISILSTILIPNCISYIKKANSARTEQIGRMIYTSAMRVYISNKTFTSDSVNDAIEEDLNLNDVKINVNEPSIDGTSITISFEENNINNTVCINGKSSSYNLN